MTLKEKFTDAFKSGKRFDIQNAETIAEEFAINFGRWMINDAFAYNTYLYEIQDLKELLAVYKKVKGL